MRKEVEKRGCQKGAKEGPKGAIQFLISDLGSKKQCFNSFWGPPGGMRGPWGGTLGGAGKNRARILEGSGKNRAKNLEGSGRNVQHAGHLAEARGGGSLRAFRRAGL